MLCNLIRAPTNWGLFSAVCWCLAENNIVKESLGTSRRKFCVKFVCFNPMGWRRGTDPKMEKFILLLFGCFTPVGVNGKLTPFYPKMEVCFVSIWLFCPSKWGVTNTILPLYRNVHFASTNLAIYPMARLGGGVKRNTHTKDHWIPRGYHVFSYYTLWLYYVAFNRQIFYISLLFIAFYIDQLDNNQELHISTIFIYLW